MKLFESFKQWQKEKRKEIDKLSKKVENSSEKIKEELKKAETTLSKIEEIQSFNESQEESNENLILFKEMRKIIKNNSDCVVFDQACYNMYEVLKEQNYDNESNNVLKQNAFDCAMEIIKSELNVKKQKKKQKEIKIIPHNSWEMPQKLSKRQRKKQKKREQRALKKARKQEKKERRGQISMKCEYIR
jgi:hypothetical protein